MKQTIICILAFLWLSTQNGLSQSASVKSDSVRTKEKAIGFEFWGTIRSIEREFAIENYEFFGAGAGFTETGTKSIDIKPKSSKYDVGIFFRFKRVKIGWIPTADNEKSFRVDNHIPYVYKFNGIERPLGGYEVELRTFNLSYLELYGLKGGDLTANMLIRVDHFHLKGMINTYKYPFGDDWYKPLSELVIDSLKVNEGFGLLALGPKLAYNLGQNTNALGDNPLKYFKKFELLILIDALTIGNNRFKLKDKDYNVSLSVVLEF